MSLIWSAYLLADWIANFAVGLMASSQGGTAQSGCSSSGYTSVVQTPLLPSRSLEGNASVVKTPVISPVYASNATHDVF